MVGLVVGKRVIILIRQVVTVIISVTVIPIIILAIIVISVAVVIPPIVVTIVVVAVIWGSVPSRIIWQVRHVSATVLSHMSTETTFIAVSSEEIIVSVVIIIIPPLILRWFVLFIWLIKHRYGGTNILYPLLLRLLPWWVYS